MRRLREWAKERRGDLTAIAVLAVMPFLVFWQGLANPADIANEDAANLYQPYYTLASNEVQAGRFPGWNPYLRLGMPYHASLQGALFYPLRWPLFWIPYLQAYVISMMVHYFLGAVATYLFMRIALKVGPLAGLLGAMSVAFGGFFMGHMSHWNYFQAYPWLMGCILLIWLAVERGQWRWAVWAGLCVGLMALIGAVHLILILGVMLGVFALYHTVVAAWRASADRLRGVRPRWAPVVRPAASVAIAMGLGFAIGAVQLLPARELYKASTRTEPDWKFIVMGSAEPVRNGLQLVVPFYYGNSRLGYWDENNYPDMAHYTGVVVLLAAVVGVVCLGRDRRLWYLVFLAIAGFLVAAGKYLDLYKFLYDNVPGFKQLRAPGRIFWCTDLAVACLGAVGIERALIRPLQDGRVKLRRALAVGAGAIVILIILLAMWQLAEYANDPKEPADRELLRKVAGNPNIPPEALRGVLPALVHKVNENPNIFNDMWKPYRLWAASDMPRRVIKERDLPSWGNVLAGVAGAVVLPFLIYRGRGAGRFAAGALVAILALDLFCLSFGMVQYEYPVDGKRLMSPTVGTPPQAKWLQEHLGIQRYMVLPKSPYPTPDDQIVPNRGMQFGLRYVSGVAGGILDSIHRSNFIGFAGRPDIMNLVGVRYIFSEAALQHPQLSTQPVWQDDRYWVYENKGCLPMAFFVKRLVQVRRPYDVRGMIEKYSDPQRPFDPREVAFVYEPPPAQTADSNAAAQDVKIVQAVPGRWDIQAQTDAPAQLLVSEGYDPGWRCRIDDAPTPVFQTDDELMSVPVPAGSRRVVLEYFTPGLGFGGVVSVLGLLACVALLVGGWWMRKRRGMEPVAHAQVAPPVPARPTSGSRKRRRR